MKTRRSGRGFLTAFLMLALVVGGAAAPGARTSDRDASTDFQAKMSEAVKRMHADMHVPFTGDADRDFARMMIPHHQGAIDMALVEIRYGKATRLKRLAQEIIVNHQQETAVLPLALAEPLPPGRPGPPHPSSDPQVHH